jgi:hypothetical protein
VTLATEYQQEISKLRQENEALRAENRALKGTAHVPSTIAIKRKLDIPFSEAALLVALSDGSPHAYSCLSSAIGSRCNNPNNLIRVYTCRLLKRFDWLRIVKLHGFGAVMDDPGSLRRVSAIIRRDIDV